MSLLGRSHQFKEASGHQTSEATEAPEITRRAPKAPKSHGTKAPEAPRTIGNRSEYLPVLKYSKQQKR